MLLNLPAIQIYPRINRILLLMKFAIFQPYHARDCGLGDLAHYENQQPCRYPLMPASGRQVMELIVELYKVAVSFPASCATFRHK